MLQNIRKMFTVIRKIYGEQYAIFSLLMNNLKRYFSKKIAHEAKLGEQIKATKRDDWPCKRNKMDGSERSLNRFFQMDRTGHGK